MTTLIIGGVAGLGAARVVRSRELRTHPERTSMTRAQRYRYGWRADRYSARSWALMALFFTAFDVGEIWMLTADSNGGSRVVGAVGAVLFSVVAAVSWVQCARRSGAVS